MFIRGSYPIKFSHFWCNFFVFRLILAWPVIDLLFRPLSAVSVVFNLDPVWFQFYSYLVTFGHVRSFLVIFGLFWSFLVNIVHILFRSFLIRFSCVFRPGYFWSALIECGPLWFLIFSSGTVWFRFCSDSILFF